MRKIKNRNMEKEIKKKLRVAYLKLMATGIILIGIVGSLVYSVYYFPPEGRHNTESSYCEIAKIGKDELTWYMDFPEEDIKDTVLITWYNPSEDQCDSDPLITADMSVIDLEELKNRNIRWIAVSRDLLKTYSLGDTVTIDSPNQRVNGEWVIHDVMNKRFTKRIDLLVSEDDTYYGLKMPKVATIKKV